MKKLNVTPGEFKAEGVSVVRIEDGYIHAALPEDDAILYSDSITTYNKCGKLPSELMEEVNIKAPAVALLKQNEKLLEERNELVKALKRLIPNMKAYAFEYHKNDSWFERVFVDEIALLTKIENNQTPQPNL